MRTRTKSLWRIRSTSAFTLIEIMTVLVVIGILTAMIVPEMKGTFEDTLLRSAGRDLVNVIELVSSRAVSLNQTLRIQLETGNGRFLTERQVHGRMGQNFVPLEDMPGSVGKLDQRIAIELHTEGDDGTAASADDQALTFYPDGTADRVLVLLKDRAGFRLALQVNPITSRVTISEPKHE